MPKVSIADQCQALGRTACSCQCYSACNIFIYWTSVFIFFGHQYRFWWGSMGRREQVLMNKFFAGGIGFVKPLFCGQHLPKGVVTFCRFPWPLDSGEVSYLGVD